MVQLAGGQVNSNYRFDRDSGAGSFGQVGGGLMIEIKEFRSGRPQTLCGQPER
jgi:hypothetical protein